MKQAAVMLIIKDGLILGVSRKNDKNKYGLPGGRIEKNETTVNAAIRETIEETSIIVSDCVEIFSRVEKSLKGDHFTTTFLALDWTGNPIKSEEGDVKWITKYNLINDKAAFPDYNKHVLYNLKKLYPHIYKGLK